MKIRWTIPSVETAADPQARRILSAVRDNLTYIYTNFITPDDLAGYGFLKKDVTGKYYNAIESSASSSSVSSDGYTAVEFKSTAILFSSTSAATYYTNISLPNNARVIKSWYEVTAGLVAGATAELVVRVKYDGSSYSDIVTKALASSFSAGVYDGVQSGAAANFTQKTTARRSVEYTVENDSITSGRIVLFVQYAIIN